MLKSNTYTFDDARNYDFDPTKVEVNETDGIAQLRAPYQTDSPTIKPLLGCDTDLLTAFSVAYTKEGNDDITFTLDVNGVEKYWNGSSWANSTGPTETNSATDIQANLAALDLTTGARVTPVAYLYSETGATTPILNTVSMTYQFFPTPQSQPSTCLVNGYIRDAMSAVIPNATVEITISGAEFVNEKNYFITNKPIIVMTDSNGYFEKELIWSTEFPEPLSYTFRITPLDSEEYYEIPNKLVPSLGSADFDELLDAS